VISTPPEGRRRPVRLRLPGRLVTVSWRDLLVVVLPVFLLVAAAGWAAIALVRPAPPHAIHLLGGIAGSSYRTNADRYKKIIEGYGVKVEVLDSQGALDNLQRLANPADQADVGFVQAGLTDGVDISRLVSLGSLFAQPLMVYYRNPEPIERLSQLKGKRLAIGPRGSGTRALAQKLLKANEIDVDSPALLELGGEDAANALLVGEVDAAFLMGDSATPKIMRRLRDSPGIEMMNFRQAAGYVRKFPFLTRLTLPEGAMDLARNHPPRPYELVGPTVELVARKDLHPALSDLLIGAARQVHGRPGLYRDAGQYPAPLEHDFPISDDAERYYKSGGQFLYKRLPFWLASLLDRMLVVVVPLLVLILPVTRVAPSFYRWRVRSRIYRFYGALMAIERDMLANPSAEQRAQLNHRLDEIENAVNEIRTPLSFADQLYVLREHVSLVRRRLRAALPEDVGPYAATSTR
jgi:TRAP-type uncharacterized transport system substrate-binding protein